MRMEPAFEKANEIYFRLGIIYKQQQKFGQSLEVSVCYCGNPRGIKIDLICFGSASNILFMIRQDP